MNIFKYIELGTAGAETVASFVTMIAVAKAIKGSTITANQIVTAVSPVITALRSGWSANIPTPLVADISQAAATAINKYVLS